LQLDIEFGAHFDGRSLGKCDALAIEVLGGSNATIEARTRLLHR
jgi:hypothetical protein